MCILIYIRHNHPFFGVFYGHILHPYNPTERRWVLFGINCIAFGNACFMTFGRRSQFFSTKTYDVIQIEVTMKTIKKI